MNTARLLYRSLLFMLLAVSLLACKNEEAPPPQPPAATAPVIELTSPTALSVFYSPDTIRLRGTLTDANGLRQYHIRLVNKSRWGNPKDTLYYDYTAQAQQAKTLPLTQDIYVEVTDHTDFELTVTATNTGGQTVTQTLPVHFMP